MMIEFAPDYVRDAPIRRSVAPDRVSRKMFRALPLKVILWPPDGPVLVHWFDAPEFIDWDGTTKLARPKLDELRQAYPRAPSNIATDTKAQIAFARKREMHASQVRRLWNQMVEQADYWAVPGEHLHGVQMVREFAPDA